MDSTAQNSEAQLKLLFHDLTLHPERVNAVAVEIKLTLSKCLTYRAFVEAVKCLLNQCFCFNPLFLPTVKKLLELLLPTGVTKQMDEFVGVKTVLEYALAKPRNISEGMTDFNRSRPFITHFIRNGLMSWTVLRQHVAAARRAKMTVNSLLYQFALLESISSLIDSGHIPENAQFEGFPLDESVYHLNMALKGHVFTDQRTSTGVATLLVSLERKKRWQEMVRSNASSSTNMKLAQDSVSRIQNIMGIVLKSRRFLERAIVDVISLLNTSRSEETFIEAVAAILEKTWSCSNAEDFLLCTKLIENLQNLRFTLASGGKAVSFREATKKALVSHYLFDIDPPTVPLFFRLTCELVRLRIVPRDIVQFVLANLPCCISSTTLFSVLQQLDKLMDDHILNFLTDGEISFCKNATEKLAATLTNTALCPKQSATFSLFLESINKKGGWDRDAFMNPADDYGEYSQDFSEITIPMISSVVGNISGSVSDCTSVDQTMPYDDNCHWVTHLFFVSDAAFRALILSISIEIPTGRTEQVWLTPLVAQLKSLPSPFDFFCGVEVVLVKLFELIEDDRSLKLTADICLHLCKADYGRAKSFVSLMQQFSVKYITGQNRSDFKKSAQKLQGKIMSADQIFMGTPTFVEELVALEHLFEKRRIGCIRLIGRLFHLKLLDAHFVMLVADSLLSISKDYALGSLSALLSDVGRSLSEVLRVGGFQDWWKSFFAELNSMSASPSLPDSVKKLAENIVTAEKNSWSEVTLISDDACQNVSTLLQPDSWF